jgi:hypothetical protein
MKKAIKLFVAVILMAGFTTGLKAQGSLNASVGALIVDAMGISEGTGMHFGTMFVPSTVATVILATDDSRTTTGTITLLPGPIAARAGSYDITGIANAGYTITIDASTTITSGIPADDMTVDNFVCSYGGKTSNLSAGGADSFKIGATLHLASGQPTGTYSGNFNISVDYN